LQLVVGRQPPGRPPQEEPRPSNAGIGIRLHDAGPRSRSCPRNWSG